MELFKPGNTTYFDVRPKPNVKLKPSDDSLYLNLSMEWTYTFEHPYDEQGRWKLIEGDSIVLVESPFHLQKQAFVIDHIQKGLYSMTVTCHHYFVESAYTQILDRRAVDATPQRAMDILFEGSEFSGKAEAGFNTQNSIYYSQDNILNFVKGENKDNTLSQRWGGEFFYDNRVLKWYEVLNKDKVFKIIFSHNLTELGLEEDWKGVYTRVYPKAYNGRMLSEPHYINSERVGNYRKVKSTWVNFDDIGLKQDYEHYNEENPPDNMTLYDTQQQLEAAIHRKVKKLFDGGLDLPTITGTVNAALLHNSLNRNGTIELPGLGYTVKAYNKLTNMEYQSRIIAVDWNTVKKRFNSIELGDSGSNQNYFDKISSTVDKVVEEINQSNKVDWNQVIKDTSEKLTEYINNGTYYGHVKITKNELLILDNPDLDRARKVWRWNMGGLGFSTSGYGGPYETAITADGKMVINEATAQTIKATMIRAGVLASMDNSSWFNLDDGTFSWANGAITFDKENGLRISIDGKPLDELLKNNLTVSANKEHQIIVLDEDGTPSYGGTYPFEFSVYTMGTTSKVHSVIKSATASDSNVVATFEPNSNIVKITVDTNRVFTAKEGYVDVVVETMYHDVEKRITWSAVTDGVDASYVKILSTGQVFSMAASESSYSPSSISLTPNMTNCSFSSWQYSVDGSIWNPVVSGQHGLTIGGDKKLTVANTCDLFTDTLTTINFRVNCTENASDTTSLTRIRDGVQGSDAVIVQLDNENHTFLGDKSGKAVPITLTINILGYSGLIKKPTTVGSITGAPTGMTVTAANNNTTNNRITIQVTSAMVSTSGVVTIPITCMGLTFNKTFSYTLSLPGSDGSAARLATIQPEQGLVFKCASDSSTFNPNVLVLTPIFSNTSFSKWQYRDSEGIWKDLTPETGEDTEWLSCGNHIYQNKNTKQLRVFSYTPLLNNGNALAIKLISNTNESDVVTLVKIKDGNTGPQGPAGSNGQTGPAGSNAINIIVSGEQVFKYSNNFTSGPTPTSIKLTATKINTTAQGKWEYLNESGAWTQISADSGTSNTSTVSISPTTGILSTAKSMRVRYIVGSIYDEMTIIKVSDGSNGTNGSDGKPGAPGAQGPAGTNGKDSYTVILTNESHTFVGDVSNALAGDTSSLVLAYKGNTKMPTTIGSITGMPTGMSVQVTNNNSTNAGFTVTVTTSLTTKTGVLKVPITVDGISFTKNFSFSLSLKGQTGEQGPAGQNGKGISKIENFYLVSSASSGITTSTGGWSTAIPTLTSTNKYLWNYEKITYTDNSTTSINPVVIGVYGDKGQAGANGSNGADGNGIKSITEYYLVSSSGSGVTTNTPGWSTTVPAMTPTKKYLWNYEVIAYTSSGNTTSTPKVIGVYGDTGQTGPQGPQGNAGKGVSKIENFYLVSTSSTGVTTQTGGWSTSIPTLTSTNRFLWNYEKITYTTGDVTITTPVVIGVYGDKGNTGATGPAGATGNGIKSITEYYLATSSSSGVTTSTSGWTTAIQSMTTTNRYLWNYEVIAYTNGTSTTTTPKIIGVYGNTGPQGPQGEEGATPNFNLVQNSGFLQGLRNWSLSTNVTIDNNKKLDGNPSCKSSQSGLTTDNWRGCINYNLPNKPTTFKKGEKLTASMYYFVEDKSTFDNNLTLEVKGKKVGSSTEGGMFSYEVTPSSIVEGKWTRVSTTVVLSEDFNEVCIRACVKKNGTAWFTNFKLERGDLTSWLPTVDEMQGINIILTNESHTLAAQSNGQAVPTTISTGVVGYIGATQTPCTIGNISGLPKGMTASIANNNTNNATVNFSVTSSLTTKQGTITIPVTCGGVTINKIFSYSLALDGTPASNVKIGTPSNTFLSNDGGNTYNPTTITLTGSFVQCSYSKWQYTTGTSFSDVVSGANGFTINGDKSLAIAVTSPLFGSKAGSITIKLLSNVGTAYDIITINKLVQVANISEELKDIKSQITTSNNKWEAAFSTGNANNLLYDGDFKIDVKHWVDNGGSLGVSNSNHFPFFDSNKCLYTAFKSTEISGVRYAYDLELRPGTDYVFEAWVYVSGNVKAHDVLRFWSWKGSSPSDQNLCQKKEYQQAVTPGRYSKCWVHFKTPDSATEVIKWRGFIQAQSNTGSTVTVNVRQVSLREASMPGAWQPNANEIVAGITTINQEGIKVEHTNVGTYTTMTADGFSIRDTATGDVLAWLSNKTQWTELKVDKVFANNLENVYEGPDSLCVNHSSSSAGTGSSSSPFNSFASLQDYLGRTPVINKDLNIIVRDPKVEINEQFYLHDLKGTGIINITLEGSLVIRSGGNGVPAVRFAQVDKWIKFVSGRQFGSATTGAVICDNPNVGGGGHGIFATDVRKLEVDAMTIACKNWGIVCERTDLYTWHIDFGKCYTAVELRFMSMYYSSDDVGSNANFCLIKSGSKAFWGYDGGTPHRPQGTVNASNGIYYSHSNCTPTPSTRFGGGNPVPPSSAQVYTQTFGWTSHKTYQYQWGNWGDSDCKQGSWGYGLRGGHMFFDIGAIRNFLGNTIEEGNTITLTRANNGGISGGAKVYINGSNCSSPSGTPSYGGQTYLGTLAWGETKTFTLPKALVQGLKSGSYNSLAVYVNSSASDCYLNIVNCSITLKTKK